jgi:TolA-binding protein
MNARLHIQVMVLLAAVFLGTSGCVYYNTFYNARKRYEEADRKRLEMEESAPGGRRDARAVYSYRDLYMKAITKASVVLDRHPKSKWVDDSLLLIGKSFYWRGVYSEALVKFEELQQNFPDSELNEEARYWQAMSLWRSDRANEARPLLIQIGQTGSQPFSGLARIAQGDLEAEQESHEAAIRAYREALPGVDGKTRKASLWEGIGNGHFQLKQYDEALEAYRQVLRNAPDTPTNYATRLQIGALYEARGQNDEAMRTYERMLGIKRLHSYEPQVRLRQANAYRLMGRLDEAFATYEDVIKRFPRSDDSAEAYYRMGLIEQKQHSDMEKAKELYDLARKERSTSDGGRAATEVLKHLNAVGKYSKLVEKDDDGSLDALFAMAEIYLLNLGEPDSALVAYRKALAMGDTTDYAPKAMFAIGLIYADSLGNESAAREAFQILIDRYPVSPHAVQARARIKQERADDALAEARFLEAESLRLGGAHPDDYISILKQLPQEYPNSLFAPKAMYALAWTYENSMRDLAAARKLYEQLGTRYPLTRFAEAAKEKIESGLLNPPEPPPEKKPPEEPAPADTSAASASSDSLALTTATDDTAASVAPEAAEADSTVVPARAGPGAISDTVASKAATAPGDTVAASAIDTIVIQSATTDTTAADSAAAPGTTAPGADTHKP